ncbi:MAG: ribosome-associated translation inhibitor RaiA [Candidatus Omnitrophica bacterium]|nr:ribosome-associated translation inhibitor RaiA [Candidatus Omnitrophota bacterium]
MEIDISGRHTFEVSEMLRAYTLEKMTKLDKYSLKMESAHVVFHAEKINETCEIVLLGKNLRISAKETTRNMQASLDAAVHKLQKQLERYHDRIKDKRAPRAGELVEEHEIESEED